MIDVAKSGFSIVKKSIFSKIPKESGKDIAGVHFLTPGDFQEPKPVSYTHLTLPTILLV